MTAYRCSQVANGSVIYSGKLEFFKDAFCGDLGYVTHPLNETSHCTQPGEWVVGAVSAPCVPRNAKVDACHAIKSASVCSSTRFSGMACQWTDAFGCASPCAGALPNEDGACSLAECEQRGYGFMMGISGGQVTAISVVATVFWFLTVICFIGAVTVCCCVGCKARAKRAKYLFEARGHPAYSPAAPLNAGYDAGYGAGAPVKSVPTV